MGSNPADGDGLLRAINIRSRTFFGREVKPSAPGRKILRHVKDSYTCDERYFVGKIHGYFSPSSSCFVTRCLMVSDRELWWMNQE
jgi:hypothetical protein